MRAHVLLVEDRDDHASVVEVALRDSALVTRATDADAALVILRAMLPDAVLTDLHAIGGASPVDYVASLRVALDTASARLRAPRVPIVLTSGIDPAAQHAIAGALVGVHALPKPYGPRALRELVERLTAPRGGAHPGG